MDRTWMKTKPTVLSKGERDILIMAAIHPGGRHLSFSEIGQRRSVSVNSVRMAMHRVCVKLEARSRYQAILVAVSKGEINPDEYLSPDELVQTVSTLGPDLLRELARLLRQNSVQSYVPEMDETKVTRDRRHDALLTNREREVLILVARGLPNVAISKRLYISVAAVRVCLSRACAKLGARNRGDAVVLAMKQREIGLNEMYSLEELVQMWAPLGAELIDNTVKRLSAMTDRPMLNHG
jgi:DNA-binding NarL/FixJ family response regulator